MRLCPAGNPQQPAAGLSNVRLVCASFADLGAEFGAFDYIVSHGVFSWVNEATQDAMLGFCSQRLTPRGVAYISYNTYPGWRMRGIVRDLMRYHLSAFANPEPALAVQQARAMLQFAAEQLPQRDSAYGRLLQEEMAHLATQPDYYLFHEHLEQDNHPLYFHEFAARAAAHRLQYLADADLASMFAHNFPSEVAQTVLRIAPDIVRAEQIMDFLRNRAFRQTLLCSHAVPLNRNLRADVLHGLAIAAPLRQVDSAVSGSASYSTPAGVQLATPDAAIKAALDTLALRWPQPAPFASLLLEVTARLQRPLADPEVQAIGDFLLRMLAASALEIWPMPAPQAVTEIGERPRASVVAREQARRALPVANLRHDAVNLDALGQFMLPLLDGEHDQAALAQAVFAAFRSGALVMNDNGQPVTDESRWLSEAPVAVDRALQSLAKAWLLKG